MKPEFIQPSSALSHLISHYLILRSDEKDVTFKDRFIPEGQIAIVFLIRVKQAFVYVEEKKPLPPMFLVIPKILPLSIETTLPGDSIIIICKASVLSSIFNIRFNKPSTTPNIEIDLFKGFPMIEKLRNIDKTEERIKFFENYLLQNFPVANYVPDDIDLAYNRVIENEGNGTVSEIIHSSAINYRTFRRNFHFRVGISLKGLMRIVRVKYLWRIIVENNDVDFQSLVLMGNFHDQAHLINDFKKIVGETPKEFFSRNLENVKLISGFKS